MARAVHSSLLRARIDHDREDGAAQLHCYMRDITGVLLVATLGACAQPHVFGLRHDPTFTYQSLDSGSIAVGGVTSITGDEAPTPATRGQFESLLATALREAYPRLKVVSAGAVAGALGDGSHGELLARYRLAGELDSAALQEMSNRLSNLRYVVLARIEADVTDSSETVTQDSLGKKSKYEQVALVASRTMTVGFLVYDISLRRAVWSGRLAKSDSASNNYVEPRGFVESLVTALLRGSHKYPGAPQQLKVLRLLFEEFAESLPQPPKRRTRRRGGTRRK
jgi:hypothetical protein